MVGGQRGTLLHGDANGKSWQRLPLEQEVDYRHYRARSLDLALGLAELIVKSVDGGQRFEEQ